MMTEEGFVMPVGFKFLPTEEQLLSYFLYKKVTRELSPVDTMFVKECDIYGDKDPWQIWDDNGGGQMEAQNSRDLYLFTQLKQINEKNGSRMKRTVGGGTWSADSTIEIYSESPSTKEKVLLGFKKRFGYESKTKQKKERLMGNNNIGWIMFEFSLNPKMLPPSCPNDYVLCLLRKPPISKKRKLLRYYLQEEVQDVDDYDQGRAKRLEASHPSSSSSVQQYEGNGEGVSSNCDDDVLVTCPLQQVTTGNIRVLQYDQTTSNYYYNTPPPALITSDIGGGSTDVISNGLISNSTSLITNHVGGGSTDVTNGIFSNSTSLITSDVGGGSTDVTNGIISNSTSSSLITSDVGGGGGSTAVTNGVSSDSTLASALVQDFLDSLLQDFGSVDEVFPDLFGDS